MAPAQSYQLHPLCRCRGTSPSGGSKGLGSPVGELSSKARLRGCCPMNGDSPKLPTTLPLPLHGTKRRYDCHRQSLYLDSLRGAPPPAGAARIPPHPTFIPQNRRNNWLHPTKNPKPATDGSAGDGGEGCVWSCLSLRRNCPLPAVWTIQFVPNLGISCQTPCQKRK